MQRSVSPEFGVAEPPRPQIFDPIKGSVDACAERRAVAILLASDTRMREAISEVMSLI